jgi:hypothetical protein
LDSAGGGVQDAASPHHPLLLEILAKELGVAVDDIVDFELNVCDTQDGVIGGTQPQTLNPKLHPPLPSPESFARSKPNLSDLVIVNTIEFR